MPDKIVRCADWNSAAVAWDEIVAESREGWFWATRTMHAYRLKYLEATNQLVADRSFFIVRDDRLVALVPFVLRRDGDTFVAGYLDAPLPWPMVRSDTQDRAAIADFLFGEIERQIRDAGVSAVSFMLAPAGLGNEFDDDFFTVVRKRHFVDTSYQSHYVEVNEHTLETVRERYRRNVRKFHNKYDITILAHDIPPTCADTYMDLHTKDAGRVVRPLATYEAQVELVRQGEGFWVCATERASAKTAGMLLVSLHKNAAYDNSVAVDPEFTNEHVSHLLKWKAIEHLIELGVSHYELGRMASAPSYLWQPSVKNYGISFFKEGWSRGRLKTVRAAEKFYSRPYFDRFWNGKREDLLNYFGI